MTIRLAVETLAELATSIDLDVPPADFPHWMDALGAKRAYACHIEDRPGIHVWFNGYLAGGLWWAIACTPEEILADGEPVDVPTGGASALVLTRAQLDYLREVRS